MRLGSFLPRLLKYRTVGSNTAAFSQRRKSFDLGVIKRNAQTWHIGDGDFNYAPLFTTGGKQTGDGGRLSQTAWASAENNVCRSDRGNESKLPHPNSSLIGAPPLTMGNGRPVLV